MSRSMRKGNTPALNSQIRPFSPNLTFKTDSLENQVLQPCQEKAEVQYLRYEIQQERQRSSQLEMQLQCEINQRVLIHQVFFLNKLQLLLFFLIFEQIYFLLFYVILYIFLYKQYYLNIQKLITIKQSNFYYQDKSLKIYILFNKNQICKKNYGKQQIFQYVNLLIINLQFNISIQIFKNIIKYNYLKTYILTLNYTIQNEQLFTNDINNLRQQNEEYKLRIQELEIKFRENSIYYQNLLKESNDKVVTMNMEIERLHNYQLNRYNDNEQILRQNDQKQLAQELIAIQKLVEDLRNELITKQKTIYYLQEQLQMTQQTQRENIGSTGKLREQEKNIDQLVSQINVLTQILEDKDNSLQQQSKQVENIYNELQQITQFNRQLNEENRNQKQALEQAYKEIERLNRIIIIKNQELQDSYHNENLDWRRNFQDLNEKYHKAQEQLCFAQAELEACRATQRMTYLQQDK